MFDWNDYLKIANDCQLVDPASSDSEAYYRCGISRAYYSVYNKSRKYIIAEKVSIVLQNGEGSHEAVIRVLNELKKWSTASNLDRLKFFRVKSDYYCDCSINEKNLSFSLSLATLIGKSIM